VCRAEFGAASRGKRNRVKIEMRGCKIEEESGSWSRERASQRDRSREERKKKRRAERG